MILVAMETIFAVSRGFHGYKSTLQIKAKSAEPWQHLQLHLLYQKLRQDPQILNPLSQFWYHP